MDSDDGPSKYRQIRKNDRMDQIRFLIFSFKNLPHNKLTDPAAAG